MEDDNKALFWGSGWDCFSNFSSFQVNYKGKLWPTSEHAYQAAKFEDDAVQEKIRSALSAFDAFTIGRQLVELRVKNWEDVKVGIMEDIVRAKLEQHSHIKETLIESGNREIIEASPVDAFWGWGPNKDGQNVLGKIWMKLREEINNGN